MTEIVRAVGGSDAADAAGKCQAVRDDLIRQGLYRADDATGAFRFRISPTPFPLTPAEFQFIEQLGTKLLAFYRGVNRLYLDSAAGRQPAWIAALLNAGKPEALVEYGRMNLFRRHLPCVIRPDLLPIDAASDGSQNHADGVGMIATELDSVPGGIGLTAALCAAYARQGDAPIGGAEGMVAGFEGMIRSVGTEHAPAEAGLLAMVVSEESRDYRPEMTSLAAALRQRGMRARVVAPADLSIDDEGLSVRTETGRERIATLYRFFELFDLKNIPKSEWMLYAAKKKQIALTPPAKAYLEEKSAFALLHHPTLASFWRQQLGEETQALLMRLFPQTWMLDPAPLPPQAILPGLLRDDASPVTDFRQLGTLSQKGRQYVVKPSGFSPLAWGSRGVSVGHDLSSADWQGVLDQALAAFPTTPHLLQRFHKGRKVSVEYAEMEGGTIGRMQRMEGRARLSPYYFVSGETVTLGGILATICPADKKLIHGMTDAIMAPCQIRVG